MKWDYEIEKYIVALSYDEEGTIQESVEFEQVEDAVSYALDNEADVYQLRKLVSLNV